MFIIQVIRCVINSWVALMSEKFASQAIREIFAFFGGIQFRESTRLINFRKIEFSKTKHW